MCKLCDNKVVYGYRCLGNTCGHKKELMNLESYNVRYWQNPNQVYNNGVFFDPFNIVDARNFCLQVFSTLSTINLMNWVCDYPQGPINLSMDDWVGRNYVYYDLLTPSQTNSYINLIRPCYPVLFQNTNYKVYLTSISLVI